MTPDLIRRLRKRLGENQHEFALHFTTSAGVGPHRQTIQGWETPEDKPGYHRPATAAIVIMEQLESSLFDSENTLPPNTIDNWTKKLWGWTRRLGYTSTSSYWELRTLSGGFSSWHHHQYKHNLFCVVNGEIVVHTEESEDTLKAGDIKIIPPRIEHKFSIVHAGVVIETYWTPEGTRSRCRADDIVRGAKGGRVIP